MWLPVKVRNWGSPAAIAKQASPSDSMLAVVITPQHRGRTHKTRHEISSRLDIVGLVGRLWLGGAAMKILCIGELFNLPSIIICVEWWITKTHVAHEIWIDCFSFQQLTNLFSTINPMLIVALVVLISCVYFHDLHTSCASSCHHSKRHVLFSVVFFKRSSCKVLWKSRNLL